MIRKKVLFFGSSPMWQVVREFSFCRSDEHLVRYQTLAKFELSALASNKTRLKS